MISKLLTNMGSMVQSRWVLYKEVAHMGLLYGSGVWLAMGTMLKVLERSHHRAAHRNVRMMDRRAEDGKWE